MAALRKVMVVGSGGREHALAWRLLESDSVGEVLVNPGNAGTARPPRSLEKVLRNVSGDPVELAQVERCDLVVVGPEAPLVEGLVDRLEAAGILAFGPSAAAARLEGSKVYMKEFAQRHGLRTARHLRVGTVLEAEQALASFETPPVVKADGLCAGKGVVVAESHDEARQAVRAMLEEQRFGAAGATVVIEEQLAGAEASMHAISDGERLIVLPSSQDHKRIFAGDQGPNTGGMGAYSPAPLVTAELRERIVREVFEPAVNGMQRDGVPYRGVLYAGLMITPAGEPYLLEFNVRFGDPETQVLMAGFDGDLAEALAAAARGRLDPGLLVPTNRHVMCVVLAAEGYPASPSRGDVVTGLDEVETLEGVRVYHAGTRVQDGSVVTAGGRVLGVTASGETLQQARDRAYQAADGIRFSGMQLRRDIGWRVLGQ